MPKFYKVQTTTFVSIHETEGIQNDALEEKIAKLRGANAPFQGDLDRVSAKRVSIKDIQDGTLIFGRHMHFPAEHYKPKKMPVEDIHRGTDLWLVVGGKSHQDLSTGTGTYTDLKHWGPYMSKKAADSKAAEVYDTCGGLVKVIPVSVGGEG